MGCRVSRCSKYQRVSLPEPAARAGKTKLVPVVEVYPETIPLFSADAVEHQTIADRLARLAIVQREIEISPEVISAEEFVSGSIVRSSTATSSQPVINSFGSLATVTVVPIAAPSQQHVSESYAAALAEATHEPPSRTASTASFVSGFESICTDTTKVSNNSWCDEGLPLPSMSLGSRCGQRQMAGAFNQPECGAQVEDKIAALEQSASQLRSVGLDSEALRLENQASEYRKGAPLPITLTRSNVITTDCSQAVHGTTPLWWRSETCCVAPVMKLLRK